MPWSYAYFLLVFFVPSLCGRHHSKSRLLRGPRYHKLSKYLLRQDALLTQALEALDQEVAVGEKVKNRHQYDASPKRHHRTQRQNHFLEKSSVVVFTEVQPYTDEFAIPDFEEVPIGQSLEASPESSISVGCQCAGASSQGNAGNADCQTTFKHQPWCYVTKGAGCNDGKSNDKMPNFDWSFQACNSGGGSPINESPMTQTSGDLEAAQSSEAATGHGGCHCAGVVGDNDAGSSNCRSTWNDIPWCYVDKASSCADKSMSKKTPTHDWSHEACHEMVAEALQAEEAMAKTSCECAGVNGENTSGASNCKSTWKNVPWCYVLKDSGCADKMTSEKMTSHDWSHEACGEMVKQMEEAELQAESLLSHNGHDLCKCSGVAGENNSGSSDCKSMWQDKSWCYVDGKAGCADGKISTKKPGYHWSHAACEQEVVIAHSGMQDQGSCLCADHTINNMGAANCKSTYDGSGIAKARAWCYVHKKSGCKDASASESHPTEFDWSYQACETTVAEGKNSKENSDPEKFQSSVAEFKSSGTPSKKDPFGKAPKAAAPKPKAQVGKAPKQKAVPVGKAPKPKAASPKLKAKPATPEAARESRPDAAPTEQSAPDSDPEMPNKSSDTPVGAILACRCSEGFATGDGGKDCGSLFEDKAWCYVDADSTCNDTRQSSRFPDRDWSHMACARPL